MYKFAEPDTEKGTSMTRIAFIILIAITVTAMLMVGCKSDSQTAAAGEGVVSGTIYDGVSGDKLAGVAVQATSASAGQTSLTTDNTGEYSFKFTVDSTLRIAIKFSKSGYNDTTITVGLTSGSVTPLDVRMTPKSIVVPPGGGSGLAQTIAYLGAQPSEVSVYGVGGKETSILRWEVRDSLGLPIDENHAVTLRFTTPNGPNGGEYISPQSLTTNSAGQGATTLNAGTRSGVVQVVASTTVPGTARTISSSPVQIVIQGGFPVQSHFSIAAPQYNFAALYTVGKTLSVAVLVGDVYSNPVASRTAIYFRSSAGVVLPSVFTDQSGQGSVQLISGNPQPLGVYAAPAPRGDGYHYLAARTLGQGNTVVQDSVLILWSGRGSIKNVAATAPATIPFDIANASSATFTFEVSDILGHPLAQGTTIGVTAVIPPPPTQGMSQNQVTVVFGNNGSIALGDVIDAGGGSTLFSFTLRDGTWSITDPTPVNVTITVSGPNVDNPISYPISGIVR
jgi:hypothetical protein